MKQSKKVMFNKDLNVIVKFQGKELDLTDFCEKHPGGASIIKQYKGKTIDDIIFNPKMHRHPPTIRKKLLSYAVDPAKVLKQSSKEKLVQKKRVKEDDNTLKPSSFKIKNKEEVEDNYSVEENEGSISKIPVFETQCFRAKSAGSAIQVSKLCERNN